MNSDHVGMILAIENYDMMTVNRKSSRLHVSSNDETGAAACKFDNDCRKESGRSVMQLHDTKSSSIREHVPENTRAKCSQLERIRRKKR